MHSSTSNLGFSKRNEIYSKEAFSDNSSIGKTLLKTLLKPFSKLKEGPKFTEKQLSHMKKYDKRIKKMKKEGFEGPTYKFSGKKSKSGAHLLKEVWTKDPHK